MAEAFFALAGTVLGVLGTLATEFFRGGREDRRHHRAALRANCADFTSAITRMRVLSAQIGRDPDDEQLERLMQESHLDARLHYERLRLIAGSAATQEAGRHVLHHAFWLWRKAAQDPLAEDYEGDPWPALRAWLIRLYVEVRRELGVPHASDVYQEPAPGLEMTSD